MHPYTLAELTEMKEKLVREVATSRRIALEKRVTGDIDGEAAWLKTAAKEAAGIQVCDTLIIALEVAA